MSPIVRYMILCEDYSPDAFTPLKINIHGLLAQLRFASDQEFPLLYPELCVVLILTSCRGTGEVEIRCIEESSQRLLFSTPFRTIVFGNDPLELRSFCFRIQNCPIPGRGHMLIQFSYNKHVVSECPLIIR